MSYREQQKYLDVLRRFEKKFDHHELDDYKMLVQRHKDEEEFDKLSLERLKNLYVKYYVNREKKDLDQFFRKPDSDKPEA